MVKQFLKIRIVDIFIRYHVSVSPYLQMYIGSFDRNRIGFVAQGKIEVDNAKHVVRFFFRIKTVGTCIGVIFP